MHAYINRERMLVFATDDTAEVRQLQEAYRRGHLHFVCKALIVGNRTTLGGRRPDTTRAHRLYLAPSIIGWRRPGRCVRHSVAYRTVTGRNGRLYKVCVRCRSEAGRKGGELTARGRRMSA